MTPHTLKSIAKNPIATSFAPSTAFAIHSYNPTTKNGFQIPTMCLYRVKYFPQGIPLLACHHISYLHLPPCSLQQNNVHFFIQIPTPITNYNINPYRTIYRCHSSTCKLVNTPSATNSNFKPNSILFIHLLPSLHSTL